MYILIIFTKLIVEFSWILLFSKGLKFVLDIIISGREVLISINLIIFFGSRVNCGLTKVETYINIIIIPVIKIITSMYENQEFIKLKLIIKVIINVCKINRIVDDKGDMDNKNRLITIKVEVTTKSINI